MTMNQVYKEIIINASAEKVWAVLKDFASYPQWNLFIPQVVGEPRQGARLQIIQWEKTRALLLRPVVVVAEPRRELRWRWRMLPFPGLLEGEHSFVIRPMGNET